MNNIETLIAEITANETVKNTLAPHEILAEVDVVVNITFDGGSFYTSITGELYGRVLRGLDVSGSGETVLEALEALKSDILDNL